jgi:hypothetical protein
MSNKSYLKKLVFEEYKKQSKKLYLEKLILEEYQKIIQEQTDTEKLSRNTLELWWNKENYGKFDPPVDAKGEQAEEGYDILMNELNGEWPAYPGSQWKKLPGIRIILAKDLIKYLGLTPKIKKQSKGFEVTPGEKDAPALKIESKDIIFYPNGICTLESTVEDMTTQNEVHWYISPDENGKEVITINLSRNQEDNKVVGALYNRSGNIILEKPEEISYKNYTFDKIQSGLDWAGMAPVIGAPIDVLNTIGYIFRGKYYSAFFSALGIVPLIGDSFSASSKGLQKFIKATGLSKAKYNRLAKDAFYGNVDSIQEFYELISKSKKTREAITGVTGISRRKFLQTIKKYTDPVEISLKEIKDLLKSDKFFVPDALENSARKAVDLFEKFLFNNKKALENLDELYDAQLKFKKFKIRPSIEFLDATKKLATGNMKALSKIMRKLPTTGKLIAGIKTGGLSAGAEAGIRAVFKGVYNPEKIAKLSKLYKREVFGRLAKNDQAIEVIGKLLPYDAFKGIFQPAELRNIATKYYQKNPKALLSDFPNGYKELEAGMKIEKNLQKLFSRSDFWKNSDLIDQLKDTLSSGKSGTDKLLQMAAESKNPALQVFFNNKQWQFENIFKGSLDFFFNFGTEYKTFLSNYVKLRKNFFGWKTLDIWWNELTELAGRLNLGRAETADPDSIIVPILFGMLDITQGKPLGTTKDKIGRSSKLSIQISGILDTWFKFFTGQLNIIPGFSQLGTYIYDFIYKYGIKQLVDDPDGGIKFRQFKIPKESYNYLYNEAKNANPGKTITVDDMMKIFDSKHWTNIPPEIKPQFEPFRTTLRKALQDQLIYNPPPEEEYEDQKDPMKNYQR